MENFYYNFKNINDFIIKLNLQYKNYKLLIKLKLNKIKINYIFLRFLIIIY